MHSDCLSVLPVRDHGAFWPGAYPRAWVDSPISFASHRLQLHSEDHLERSFYERRDNLATPSCSIGIWMGAVKRECLIVVYVQTKRSPHIQTGDIRLYCARHRSYFCAGESGGVCRLKASKGK
jgi:hypothetical protein